ncbi:hypothetical protein [Prosthecomicrobium pneumaticum]|uniref:Uncharacterized protein n=1 Tax=Prosthecomicrobium pneumaticum TaxID=81895 RepID=A0A7W9CUL7_9HYPH|nr:hypothetical protein [Prosthecomicrobium pneumaticum]MBB5751667.1 hypothetical protein [Prosthecomicrobium pneumaticum]
MKLHSALKAIGISVGLAVLAPQFAGAASPCKTLASGTFAGEDVLKLRAEGRGDVDAFAVFRAPLAVNTDGAPVSYHPLDPKGERLAINRIDNGIAIWLRSAPKTRLRGKEFFDVYEQWREAGFPKSLNETYAIGWESVLAPDPDSGGACIFKSGKYKGYFGSMTKLTNGRKPSDSGECLIDEHLDQRYIPAIVLRGEDNPLRNYGAGVGDLVIAINPRSNIGVPAIIGDYGDGHRIGEGSVALNMALLGQASQPKNYKDAKALDTGKLDIVVAILPGSVNYRQMRPYTADNIEKRVGGWLENHGYGTLADFAKLATACSEGL